MANIQKHFCCGYGRKNKYIIIFGGVMKFEKSEQNRVQRNKQTNKNPRTVFNAFR